VETNETECLGNSCPQIQKLAYLISVLIADDSSETLKGIFDIWFL